MPDSPLRRVRYGRAFLHSASNRSEPRTRLQDRASRRLGFPGYPPRPVYALAARIATEFPDAATADAMAEDAVTDAAAVPASPVAAPRFTRVAE